ncbi:hypothetical protein TIFTF001_025750 [Ficus carica]|uniref:Purple acid phosphatase C-terminal domain-containing protein n=1 Tax=Ficus carica TaxID=3494 RepID=A0AA88B1L2_FICCA|nr:hypothetical protein TIFTF001_025750 [Ficus carica]
MGSASAIVHSIFQIALLAANIFTSQPVRPCRSNDTEIGKSPTRKVTSFSYDGVVNGVIVGGGGRNLSDYSILTPYWSAYKDRDFGFVKLTAYNHSSLLFE